MRKWKAKLNTHIQTAQRSGSKSRLLLRLPRIDLRNLPPKGRQLHASGLVRHLVPVAVPNHTVAPELNPTRAGLFALILRSQPVCTAMKRSAGQPSACSRPNQLEEGERGRRALTAQELHHADSAVLVVVDAAGVGKQRVPDHLHARAKVSTHARGREEREVPECSEPDRRRCPARAPRPAPRDPPARAPSRAAGSAASP